MRWVRTIRKPAGAMEEKAGWGIFITTSRFTAGSEKKAREHGRMELIGSNRLAWLIKEHLGKDVLVVRPHRDGISWCSLTLQLTILCPGCNPRTAYSSAVATPR